MPAATGSDVTEVLLAALRLAVSRARTGADTDLLVDVERHGRDGTDADLTRTVGWLTGLHPVRLPAADDPLGALDGVRQAVRSAPDSGAGYGMLRHLNPQLAPSSPGCPRLRCCSTTSAGSRRAPAGTGHRRPRRTPCPGSRTRTWPRPTRSRSTPCARTPPKGPCCARPGPGRGGPAHRGRGARLAGGWTAALGELAARTAEAGAAATAAPAAPDTAPSTRSSAASVPRRPPPSSG
ncbi:hypothetical protein ACFQ60_08130 [Streptomyces zhihengii]